MENYIETQEILSFLKADVELLQNAANKNTINRETEITFDVTSLEELIKSLQQVHS